MTFTDADLLEKLEDGSKQTRRLTQLEPRDEVTRILGDVAPIESGGSPKQASAVSR